MKVAICISGHLRTFDKCIKNIRENIFNPIKEAFDTSIFLSTWNDNIDLSFIKDDNIKIHIEDFFTFNLGSMNYLKFPNLCCSTTCDNAASMWYKCKKVFDMVDEKYDIIIRIRPDIIYENKIDINLIKESVNNNKIYMSKSPGWYLEVTKGMLDPFLFGNFKLMSNVMNIYDNIPNYIKDDSIPHTIEGFLYESTKNINLERINFNYSVLRQNGIIEKLYLI